MSFTNNRIKYRIPIAILLWIYVTLSLISNFIYGMDGSGAWHILKCLYYVVPHILLARYFVKSYKTQNVAPYLVLSFLATGVYTYSYSFSNMWSGGSSIIYAIAEQSYLRYVSFYVVSGLSSVLLCLSIFYIVKCSKKANIITILCFCMQFVSHVLFYILLRWYNFFCLAELIYFAAIIIYVATNDITAGLKDSNGSSYVSIAELPPDKALMVIRDKLEVGLITEEEYLQKRSEIISKL